MAPILVAFLITLLAGLATAVGGVIAISTRRGNRAFLAVALAFSAGGRPMPTAPGGHRATACGAWGC